MATNVFSVTLLLLLSPLAFRGGVPGHGDVDDSIIAPKLSLIGISGIILGVAFVLIKIDESATLEEYRPHLHAMLHRGPP
jgi:hypothetical protein